MTGVEGGGEDHPTPLSVSSDLPLPAKTSSTLIINNHHISRLLTLAGFRKFKSFVITTTNHISIQCVSVSAPTHRHNGNHYHYTYQQHKKQTTNNNASDGSCNVRRTMNWSVIKRNETGIPGPKLGGGGDIGGSVVVGSVGALVQVLLANRLCTHTYTHIQYNRHTSGRDKYCSSYKRCTTCQNIA